MEPEPGKSEVGGVLSMGAFWLEVGGRIVIKVSLAVSARSKAFLFHCAVGWKFMFSEWSGRRGNWCGGSLK